MSPPHLNPWAWRGLHTLQPNVKGALWYLLGGAVFSLMNVLVKHLGQDLHGFQIAFFRSLFAAVVLSPVLMRHGIGILRTVRPGAHALRVLFGLLGLLTIFYALTKLPVSTTVSITFAQPLVMLPLAVLFLGERLGWRRTAATAVGFCGVLIIVNPGGGIEPAMLVALAHTLFAACAMLMVKRLSSTEPSVRILMYFAIGTSVGCLPFALAVWQPLSAAQLGLLAVVGALGTLGQYCAVRGLAVGEASVVVPFQYGQIVFATGFAFLAFAEIPTLNTLAGAAVIIASSAYILHREARLKRPASAAAPDT